MCDFGALTLQEDQFCKTIIEVGEQFLFRIKTLSTLKNTVVLFLPTNPRGRFLIHKCIENIPELNSISIGESCQRRVVIFAANRQFHKNNNSGRRQTKSRKLHFLESATTMSSPRYTLLPIHDVMNRYFVRHNVQHLLRYANRTIFDDRLLIVSSLGVDHK